MIIMFAKSHDLQPKTYLYNIFNKVLIIYIHNGRTPYAINNLKQDTLLSNPYDFLFKT